QGRASLWWVMRANGDAVRPVSLKLHDDDQFGEIIVDSRGRTLYRFDNDTPGVSNCSGGCLVNWPPLLLEIGEIEAEGLDLEFGTITRDDGREQVTLNDLPLYFWNGDMAEGDTLGQARGEVWWVIGADGEKITEAPAAPTATPAPTPTPVASDIQNFQLRSHNVPVGTTITWTNRDSFPHTATHGVPSTPGGEFDSGTMAQNAQFSHTFDSAGAFPYYCALHTEMTASITVTAP
ncbi:MAG: plastocyanin/azurin family copper-binding protein, partial [Dehalococcoidia bacterium]